MSDTGSENPVAAVIWDMDGTLIDSTVVVCEAYAEAIRSRGGGEPRVDEILRAFPLGPPANILMALLGRAITDADVDAYYRALRARRHRVALFEGVLDAIEMLRGRVRLAVFTGASSAAAAILLAAVDLPGRLDAIVGSERAARPKPDPCGLLATCEGLKVSPAASLYVGDSPLDVECAHAAGVRAVGAAWSGEYRGPDPDLFVTDDPRRVVEYVSLVNGW